MSEICQNLHRIFNRMQRYRFPFDANKIPRNGICILFQSGENAHGMERIVRVGTHTGENQLRSRLKQHFIKENKDRSIFRKNIGRAILCKTEDPFLDQWEWDLTTGKAKDELLSLLDVDKQQRIEQKVTEYIQEFFSFVVFQDNDKKSRLYTEQKIISTLSWCNDCQPSSNWLGNYSPKKKIRDSGLWLVNGLYKDILTAAEIIELQSTTHFN